MDPPIKPRMIPRRDANGINTFFNENQSAPMKCPHCHEELPPRYVPVTCPACRQKLTGGPGPEAGENSPIMEGALLVIKVIGWTLVVLVGCVMLGLAVVFAGCVCSGGNLNGFH